MAKFTRKTLSIATGSVIIETGSAGPERADPHFTHNFVDISTATSPTAGTFSLYVETSPDSGFKALVDNLGVDVSTIDATLTGAEVADGAALGWSFNGNPYRIKCVATGVTGVTTVVVVVAQNIH